MLRPTLAILLAACMLVACGSEKERAVRAPAADSTAQACQSRVAIGSDLGTQMTEKARKLSKRLREALSSDEATVLCASDVDYMHATDADGWTPYAPLPSRAGAR